MSIHLLTSPDDLAMYDQWIKNHPQGNLWQSLEWKTYQEALGRETRLYADTQDDAIVASALVVIDRTAGGLSTWDIARGPLIDGGCKMEDVSDVVLQRILDDAKKEKCLSLFLSPTHILPSSVFRLTSSTRHEQPEATRIIDINASADDILKQMHQKGRYNIRVAQKNGVMVRASEDIDAYVTLAKKTADRDGFTAASARTYKTFLETLPGSFLLLAYAPHPDPPPSGEGGLKGREGEPVAGLIGVIWNGTGVYYYGASDHEHRALMAPYLLQWEAMKKCKEAGCTAYDLLGIAPVSPTPNPSPEVGGGLSSIHPSPIGGRAGEGGDNEHRKHPWSGISDFKAKFGGSVIAYPPEQEIILRPMLKGALQLKRRIFG